MNGYLQTRSFLEGTHHSKADDECFESMRMTPDETKYPYAYRWYLHIASLHGIRLMPFPIQLPWNEDDDISFDANEKSSNIPQRHRESRSDMMASVKLEIQRGLAAR